MPSSIAAAHEPPALIVFPPQSNRRLRMAAFTFHLPCLARTVVTANLEVGIESVPLLP